MVWGSGQVFRGRHNNCNLQPPYSGQFQGPFHHRSTFLNLCALHLLHQLLLGEQTHLSLPGTSEGKVVAIARTFNEKKEDAHQAAKKEKSEEEEIEMAARGEIHLTPGATSFSNHEEGLFSPDEGLSSTEPGTPYHEHAVIELNEDGHI